MDKETSQDAAERHTYLIYVAIWGTSVVVCGRTAEDAAKLAGGPFKGPGFAIELRDDDKHHPHNGNDACVPLWFTEHSRDAYAARAKIDRAILAQMPIWRF